MSEVTVSGNKCIVKLIVPAQYLAEDASKDRVKSLEMYKSKAKELSENGHGVIVLPALTDEQGKRLFDIEVIKV